MCQETRFPTQDREDFDSDGSKLVISEPIGPACLRCLCGLARGMPYEEDIQGTCQMCSTDEDLRQFCCGLADANESQQEFVAAGEWKVHQDTQISVALIENVEAHTQESFSKAPGHHGQDPVVLGLQPVTLQHPRAQEELSLFLTEGDPPFRLEIRRVMEVTASHNKMLEQVYSQQPQHTMGYLAQCQRLGLPAGIGLVVLEPCWKGWHWGQPW